MVEGSLLSCLHQVEVKSRVYAEVQLFMCLTKFQCLQIFILVCIFFTSPEDWTTCSGLNPMFVKMSMRNKLIQLRLSVLLSPCLLTLSGKLFQMSNG